MVTSIRTTKRRRFVSVLLREDDHDFAVECGSETLDVDSGSNERCPDSVCGDESDENLHTDNEEVLDDDDDMRNFDSDEHGIKL
jgi:hypothetical protein